MTSTVRIVTNPENTGLGAPYVNNPDLVVLRETEITVSGLKNGTMEGKPSMAIGLVLPDGTPIIAEMSWRLFAAAFWAFADKFGDERPDTAGMTLEYDPDGSGRKVHLDIVADDQPKWFQCEICGKRYEPDPELTPEEQSTRVAQWIHQHFRAKHPGWSVP